MKAFYEKYKAPIFVFVGVFLIYVLMITLTHLVALNRMEDHLDLERKRTTNQISASVDRYEVFSSYLYETLVTDEILALMSDANSEDVSVKNQAREDLENLLEEEFDVLETYDFSQLHFHLPTGESFLRLHAPDVYGDMLFDIRESIKKANTDRVHVSGFEEGRTHIGYRFVYPLSNDGVHLGSVGISISYEAVLDTLYKVSPSEDAFFIIKKSVVEDTVFESFTLPYNKSSISDDYLRNTSIFESFRHDRHNFQALTLEQFLADVKPHVRESIEEEESFSYATECDDCHYVLHFISVKNLEDEHVGYLFTIVADTHYSELIRENKTNIGLITLFFLMLFILLFIASKDRVKLRSLSRRDPLTELANRLFFTSQVEALLSSAKRYQDNLSIIMIDIDDFKVINDTYGHAEGDYILKQLANTFTGTLRASDIIGRWGGEEFLIALPNTDKASARKVAEKIRKSVKKHVRTKKGVAITISLGVTTSTQSVTSFDDLVKEADYALYQSKNNGKDQVTVYKKEKDD